MLTWKAGIICLSVEARVRVRSGEVWAGSGQAHGGARSRREEQRGSDRE